jgi:hypothetical protein
MSANFHASRLLRAPTSTRPDFHTPHHEHKIREANFYASDLNFDLADI